MKILNKEDIDSIVKQRQDPKNDVALVLLEIAHQLE